MKVTNRTLIIIALVAMATFAWAWGGIQPGAGNVGYPAMVLLQAMKTGETYDADGYAVRMNTTAFGKIEHIYEDMDYTVTWWMLDNNSDGTVDQADVNGTVVTLSKIYDQNSAFYTPLCVRGMINSDIATAGLYYFLFAQGKDANGLYSWDYDNIVGVDYDGDEGGSCGILDESIHWVYMEGLMP